MTDEVQKLKDQLIEERAQRILDYDEANPDVGMGMFRGTAMRIAEEQLGFTHSSRQEKNDGTTD